MIKEENSEVIIVKISQQSLALQLTTLSERKGSLTHGRLNVVNFTRKFMKKKVEKVR